MFLEFVPLAVVGELDLIILVIVSPRAGCVIVFNEILVLFLGAVAGCWFGTDNFHSHVDE